MKPSLIATTFTSALVGLGLISCGSSEDSTDGTGADTDSEGVDSRPWTGDTGSADTGSGEKQLIAVTEIAGGGENSAPLAPGCGPGTARECTAPGGGCDNGALLSAGEVEVKSAGAVCFFGEGIEKPSATVEHITEVVAGEEYVHLRVIFDPDFVDTVYGECSTETGWSEKKGHSLKDLKGSDHVELMLYGCDDKLAMHMKVDFLDDEAETDCGYGTAGVIGGEGEMFVGDAEHVLAVGTSLDRNMNGCGYCELENSPCPGGEGYSPSEEAPEWDFRMVYELWIDTAAFGDAGFCRPDIEYVHASPAKADDHTVIVEPDDCPPGEGDCPPNYELFLSSEGEFICAGPPDDGVCPNGYTIDLTSEGSLCIPDA